MDANTQARLDQILEDEIKRGFRVLQVPEYIEMQLKAAATVDSTVQPFSRIRLARLTPRKRRLIQEEVMTKYNKDLKNLDLLSTEELRKLNIQRGEWSLAEETEIERLTELTNTQALQLNAAGMDDRDEWSKAINELTAKYLAQLEASDKHPDEKKFLGELFERWSNYLPARKEEYTKLYAASQTREAYDQDADLGRLMDTSPGLEATEALADMDDLLGKVTKLIELVDNRTKLNALLEKRAKIFVNSIEYRRDQAEEMARVFFCAERVSPEDKSEGPLCLTFDQMWDFPEAVLQWLIEEMVMFLQNIPEVMREQLENMGFLAQVPKIGTTPVSEDLPEVPSSKPGTPELTETPASSTALITVTTSTKPSSISSIG